MDHHVLIKWGIKFEGEEQLTSCYRFATKPELDAFMQGIEEAVGWSRYEVVEDSREESNA